MDEATFREPWWPIRLAIAWIVTRNSGPVDEPNPWDSLGDHIVKVTNRDRTLGTSYLQDHEGSWLALRQAVSDGKIPASGEPSTLVERRGSGPPEYSSLSQTKPIAAAEFALSMLRQKNGDDYLAIEETHAAFRSEVPLFHGYRNVRLLRDDLLRTFPSGDRDLEAILKWQLTPGRAASKSAARRAERFSESQRLERDWIRFGEIADWCSELGGSVVPDEAARTSAYERLERDVLAGFFEETGRSCVLFMHPAGVTAKITRRRYRVALQLYDAQRVRAAYSTHCWIPRRIFDRWVAIQHLPVSPPRFTVEESNLLPAPKIHREAAAIKARPVTAGKRRSPAREFVRKAIAQLYPEGLPDQDALPNKALYIAVHAALPKGREISNDTILRAAGRRPK